MLRQRTILPHQLPTQYITSRTFQSLSPRRSKNKLNIISPKYTTMNTINFKKDNNSPRKGKKLFKGSGKLPPRAKKPIGQDSFLFEEVKANTVKINASVHTLRSGAIVSLIKPEATSISLLNDKIVIERLKEYLCFKDYLSFLLTSKRIYAKRRIESKIEHVLIYGLTQNQRIKYWAFKCELNELTNESFYEKYKRQQPSLTYEMARDVERTFAFNHSFMSCPRNKIKLENVLRAFLAKNRDIGYIQGISFIAGNLLQAYNEHVIYLITP